MVENALMFYQDKHTLNTDSLELVLRMVRERMQVHSLYRKETKKEYFDHKLPRKSFGRWLMSELALIRRMKELAKEQVDKMEMNRDQFKK